MVHFTAFVIEYFLVNKVLHHLIQQSSNLVISKGKNVLNNVPHMGFEPAILKSRIQSSMGRVVTPGGELPDGLLTPYIGTLTT